MTNSYGDMSPSPAFSLERIRQQMNRPVDILPLAVFRIAFGGLMFASTLRFILKGWVDALYIQPEFHFSYLGFEWVKPLDATGMAAVFIALLILSLCIMLGFAYRVAIALFFILFTYIELIDQATYLNHYYFVSLVSFLLNFLPAHRYLSFDARLRPKLKSRYASFWHIFVLQLQLAIVYFFAGFAKLNGDWLLQGRPLAIWLKANTGMPILGPLLDCHWVALLLSWAAAAYDLTIVVWLSWKRTRLVAYATVIAFHLLTAMLFPIGVFPYVMIASTLIFFSGSELRSALKPIGIRLPAAPRLSLRPAVHLSRRAKFILLFFFALQLTLPLRHYLYPGDANWTMEGYRFAWRVMLNEKAGFATFYLVDKSRDHTRVVYGSQYLGPQQSRHMSYQPDMILQFARFLAAQHPYVGRHELAVYAEVHVSHNGAPSKLLIDPEQNLLEIQRDIFSAPWILRY